jgi:hypothetical protein
MAQRSSAILHQLAISIKLAGGEIRIGHDSYSTCWPSPRNASS